MKKLVSLLLVLLMAMSLVSVSAVAEDGSHKLTVWCWDPAFNIYAMQEAAKFYKEIDPAFELEVIETPWNDLQTKLTTAGMAGDYSTLPDIFLCQDNAFQKNVLAFPDMFNDLTASGVDFTQFGAAKTAYSVVDGKNYGVPFDNGAVIQCVRTDILELKDLKPGMKLRGTVRNVVDFGAFVDIGVHQDGLVHISRLSDNFVRKPSDVVRVGDVVDVAVVEVDAAKKRIALSMLAADVGRN